jgi:metallo-beta-lactamase family protein
MLMDSAHIQESDAIYVSKINKRRNQPPVEPLYTRADIPPVLELIQGHGYNRHFRLPDAQAIFHDAGHVLGSAITTIEINDGARDLSTTYTGDLGRPNLPIIRDPYVVTNSDILLIESTYGDRLHGDIGKMRERLAAVINETIARKGKIIIPAFALERTQEIIYTLHRLRTDKWIPEIPVYVDSPLAIDTTEIFRLHPECFSSETNEFMRTNEDPFGFKQLHYTRTTEESKMRDLVKGPIIILAGSGMAENGRIVHHLKNNIDNPLDTVMIVGWMAENTLGRKLADKGDLIKWIKQGKDRWQKIFLVHGEESASLAFAKTLEQEGFDNVIIPELGQRFIL